MAVLAVFNGRLNSGKCRTSATVRALGLGPGAINQAIKNRASVTAAPGLQTAIGLLVFTPELVLDAVHRHHDRDLDTGGRQRIELQLE